MQNITTKIFKNPNLPYVELRFNQVIQYNPKLHIHDSLTLAALKSGALSIFPHSSQLLRNGTVALINPYHAHYGKVVEIGNDGIYVLYLDMNWCEEVQKSLFGQQHKFYPLRGGVIDDLLLYRDFFILADTLFSEVSTATKAYAVKQFALQLFCDFCDTDNSTTETSFAYAVKIFLEQNFRKNITLEDLATRFEMSPFYLLRAFKKEYGLPPHAYCLNLKVHYAKSLLDCHHSILDAALSAGFYDQSHFYHAFKRVFSISPGEYQSNFIQD